MHSLFLYQFNSIMTEFVEIKTKDTWLSVDMYVKELLLSCKASVLVNGLSFDPYPGRFFSTLGKCLTLISSVHPAVFKRCLTLISSVHPAVFKGDGL